MNYRAYLMQMAQRRKVIKTGGTLLVINKHPFMKKTFSGSAGVYNGGTIRKLIIDRLNNGIDPLTTSVSTLTIGKRFKTKKASRKSSKRKSKGGSIKRKSKASKKASKRKSSKRKSSKKLSKRRSSKRTSKKLSKRRSSKKKSIIKKGGKVARKKTSFRPLKFKI